jgi:hypothetical protein
MRRQAARINLKIEPVLTSLDRRECVCPVLERDKQKAKGAFHLKYKATPIRVALLFIESLAASRGHLARVRGNHCHRNISRKNKSGLVFFYSPSLIQDLLFYAVWMNLPERERIFCVETHVLSPIERGKAPKSI